LFANVGQSGVAEAQAHARALVVAGQPHVALTDSQYTQAYGAPVPAGDPPYVPLTDGCERTNLSFYDSQRQRLVSSESLSKLMWTKTPQRTQMCPLMRMFYPQIIVTLT